MKLLFTSVLLLTFTLLSAVTTIDPVTGPKDIFKEQSTSIDDEMSDLNELNQLIIENNYDYDELQLNHAESVDDINLSSEVDGLFDSHPDSPLGIGGFWWGCVLGWVGMLIVYLSMDEGEDRKDQVKKALYGCLIATAVGVLLWVVVIASAT